MSALPLDAMKLELAAELSHGKWADANAAGTFFPGNTPATISLAWASSRPPIEGRVKADGKSGNLTWMGWVAASYESIDLKGFGSTVAPNGVTLQDGSVSRRADCSNSGSGVSRRAPPRSPASRAART